MSNTVLSKCGRRGRDRMVVGFTILVAYAVSAFHHYLSCDFESRSWHDVLDTTL